MLGVLAGTLPWITINVAPRFALFRRVDDTLGVIHTHGVAGAMGGLFTGVMADPKMLVYYGPNHNGAGASVVTGLWYGNPHQLLVCLLYTSLKLHRNTVLYRLRRIEEVGHLRLSDPDTRLNLQLCLRIRDVLQASA